MVTTWQPVFRVNPETAGRGGNVATVTRHDLLGYREVEAATGVPGSTLRRYAKRFPAFLPIKTVDRAARFQPESVETFQRIHALYTAGKRSEDVATILADEVPQLHDVAAVAATIATTSDPAALASILPMLERLTVAVETLAAAQLETVALLREGRDKPRETPGIATPSAMPSNRPTDASQDENQGEGHADAKKTSRFSLFDWIFGKR